MSQHPKQIRISAQAHQSNLSKSQKRFNALVKKIENQRKLLAEWQIAMLAHDQKIASDYLPLITIFRELQATAVRAWDSALNQKGLTQTQRQVVQNIICEVAEQLIIETGDESLKEVYKKHSGGDFDEEDAVAMDGMKTMMEDLFKIDLGDRDDFKSPEDILAKLQAQMEEEQRLQLEAAGQRRTRKKTAKQTAREAKLQAEADQTSLSIREVYRKLVSALHPDREPNPAERLRKTALMQRVNLAYDKKDLLQLLELQLELEHIDAHAIADLSEERLKHFNKILEDQLLELEQEIAHVEMPLRMQFNLPSYEPLMPNAIMPRLKRDIAELKNHIDELRKDLELSNDPVTFKKWIKRLQRQAKIEQAEMYEDDFPFF